MKLSEKVYDLVTKIPKGKVTTYGEIARAAGKPNASQAVGQILKKNPNPIIIPCHRVVKSTRELGGYVYGSKKKFELLIRESVKISKGNILDFEKINFEF